MWRALSLLEHGEVVRVIDGKPNPDFGRMPVYPAFVAAIFWFTGGESFAAITAVQAVTNALTVLAIGLMAAALNRRWCVPAALLACVWPAFAVYAAWVLSDSLFVDLFTWGLCACVWAQMRRHWRLLLIGVGLAFGLALFTRPVLVIFPYLIVPVLAYVLAVNRGTGWLPALGHALVPVAIMLAMLSPRLIATYTHYGSPVVTTQSGVHALQRVYPCLRNDPDCDRAAINYKARDLIEARRTQLTREARSNPVILDRIRRDVVLLEVQVQTLVLAAADSAARSVLQTMLYAVGYQLDPEYFSAVKGPTTGERLVNFLATVFSDPFMFFWAVTQAGVLLALPIQIIGLVAGLRDPGSRSLVIFLVVTAAYFLAINASFGNPKYGLPLNPAQIVLLVAGGHTIVAWLKQRGNRGLTSM